MWDKMQDIMSRYNDHMMHVYIEFEGTLDKDKLRSALSVAIDKVAILKSRYYSGVFQASWKSLDGFGIDDAFKFEETGEGEPQKISESFLLKIIDERKGPQIRALLLRKAGKDYLSFLVNHQCFDGADLKEFIYLIAQIYSDLVKGGSGDIPFKNGSRSEEQIYNVFSEEQKREIDSLVSYSKKQRHKISFPFEKSSGRNVSPRIDKGKISAAEFRLIKENAKNLGVSVNDAVLAAFYRAAMKMINRRPGETLGVPNMVNLRRYIPGGESAGMCNLTSMVVANLGEDVGKDIFETVKKVKENMDALKEHYPGLHGLALLKGVFKYTPHSLAKFLIGTFFKNPLIGLSNIGVVDEKKLAFDGARVSDMFMTGSVKYPPYMQLALTTFRNEITFTIANYGTDIDHKMLTKLIEYVINELKVFISGSHNL
jgi:Uncharacterized protein containing a NRPS condensation (elongation) domain